MKRDWTRGFTPCQPPPSRQGPPRPEVIRLAYGPAPQQFGDLRLPSAGSGPFPVAVVVHGEGVQQHLPS